jgi:carbonic anhydrase/acetyltransferase-like protein (isoleucine patch superfamily)
MKPLEMPKTELAAFIAPNATIVGRVELAKGSSVWFGAILRGDNDLISIGEDTNVQDAVLLNGSHIPRHCVVGARALVTEGKTFPERSLIIGSPARAIRTLTDEDIAGIRASAAHYVDNARRFSGSVFGAG